MNRMNAFQISVVSKFPHSEMVFFGACSETARLLSALLQAIDLMSHLFDGLWKMGSLDVYEFVFGQKKIGYKSKQSEVDRTIGVEQRYQIPFLSKWNYCND